MDIQHVLTIIGIIVGATSLIITATCALALKWINTMREDFCCLRTEFAEFVKDYYVRHEDTMKKVECAAKHAVIERTVDALHERVDKMELDRR